MLIHKIYVSKAVDPQTPQTKIVWPEFDPYSATGALVMARIDELIARGKVVDAPLS